MQGFISIWRRLPLAKRMFLVGAVAATIFAFSLLARTASSPSMELLYSGLEPRVAGEVVEALERMNVPTEIHGNAIYVPAYRRDSVRMALAREGMPQQGQAGFELFENLNGLSMTSDIFDVTYWRAIEGELARTILSTPGVKAARVHIAYERGAAFSRNAPEPKAVVTVTMARGAINAAQAQSIRYLVSSSVPGLTAEQVAILDADQGVILSPGKVHNASGVQSNTGERERGMEADIMNMLEARVGPGNARVQVALEIDTEREAISERVFDPDGRVVSGKETKEISEKTTGTNGSSTTVASNLPEGDVNTGSSQSETERTQTDEVLKYDLSEIRREREKMPGSVKRLSVAVLVNHIESSSVDGETTTAPRTEEELSALRDLVAMAVGFNEARGDTLTIQNLAFQPIINEGVTVEQSALGDFTEKHMMTAIQIGVLSIVTLILGLFVVKPLLSVDALPPPQPAAPPAQALSAEAVAAVPEANPFDALKGLANEKTDETATLIKTWLEEEDAA